MILQVESNPANIKKGDIVMFLTGEKSVNTYPKVMRIGIVETPYFEKGGLTVKEISTSKIWKPYSQDIVLVNDGIPVKGIQTQIILTDKI